nr:NAD(P)-dependent oxidoreductase [Desulfobacula sp.]
MAGNPILSEGDRYKPDEIGVIGATSLVGEFLLPMLTQSGWRVTAYSRRMAGQAVNGVEWQKFSSFQRVKKDLPYWICLAPIWVLPEYFTLLKAHGVRRIVVLSSTSRFTKEDSLNPQEQTVAQRLAEAELHVQAWAEKNRVKWVILRTTMIYDFKRDQNITEIARFIRCFGFFPLLGEASGLRQPIHAQDVAGACMAALKPIGPDNRAYNLCGGETLSYREMVTRIFTACGLQARFLPVPLWAFRIAVALMCCLPRYRQWSAAMIHRMNKDMVFDNSDAVRDLRFSPRPFRLNRKAVQGV